MSRYIILIEREPKIVFPLVMDEPQQECAMVFDSRDDALEVAADHPLCRCFSYQIIDLDNTEDES